MKIINKDFAAAESGTVCTSSTMTKFRRLITCLIFPSFPRPIPSITATYIKTKSEKSKQLDIRLKTTHLITGPQMPPLWLREHGRLPFRVSIDGRQPFDRHAFDEQQRVFGTNIFHFDERSQRADLWRFWVTVQRSIDLV